MPEKIKKQKPFKFKNFLESLDAFAVEHNFRYTPKEAKGSLTGFACSLIFTIIMGMYMFNRLHLFWTHEEDSYQSYKVVQDFEKLGIVNYAETEFDSGVLLSTVAPHYEYVFDSDDELFQYINIYSSQAIYGKDSVVGGAKLENNVRLVRGCPDLN